MDGLQTMKDLLKAFGDSLGIFGLAPDEEGYACLLIDESFLVHLVYDEDAEALRLFSELCDLPPMEEEAVMRALLDANVLWRGSQGATLGLDSAKKVITLAYRAPIELLSSARFEQMLENFVSTGERWIQRIGDIARGAADDSAEQMADSAPVSGLRV